MAWIELEVDLIEFSDQDLLDEIESRGLTNQLEESEVMRRLRHMLELQSLGKQDEMNEALRKMYNDVLGRII